MIAINAANSRLVSRFRSQVIFSSRALLSMSYCSLSLLRSNKSQTHLRVSLSYASYSARILTSAASCSSFVWRSTTVSCRSYSLWIVGWIQPQRPQFVIFSPWPVRCHTSTSSTSNCAIAPVIKLWCQCCVNIVGMELRLLAIRVAIDVYSDF